MAALVIGVLAITPAFAATYYVDAVTGNDANNGLSEAAAWRTVTRSMGLSSGGGPANGAAAGDIVLIKTGTYFRNYTPGTSYDPCYNPRNSGTAGAPITFRAFPGHTVVLDCIEYGPADSQGSPVFGASSRSYITYDGMSVLANTKKNVMINNSQNITVMNGIIDRVPRVGNVGTGNYYCFFVQNSRNIVISGFLCRDSFSGSSPSDANAGGIVNFNSQNIHAHHNDFVNVGTCLDDKEAGRNNIWEYNFCQPAAGGRGVQFTSLSNFCSDCSVRDTVVRFNIFRGSPSADLGVNIPTTTTNIQVYNNTFYQFNTALRVTTASSGVRFYNNIAVLTGSGPAHRYMSSGPSSSLISDFNLYRPATPQFSMNDLGGANESLTVWRSTGSSFHPGIAHDRWAVTADPLFVSAVPTLATDFQLQGDSPALDTGNTAADGTGSALDMGAFAVAGNTPGRDGSALPPDTAVPSSPFNLVILP